MELAEKFRIIFMKANLEKMFFMDGVDLLIIMESIGDFILMD